MEAEFQRAMILVFAVGGSITLIGATILVFAFRAFGKERPERTMTPFILLGLLILFVFAACFLFLFWSMRQPT